MTMMRVGISAWHLILLAVNHYVIFYWVNEKSVDGSNGWPIKNDGLSISSIFIAQASAFFKKMRHLILYEYVWKETLLMKSWEIIFGRHYYASKRPTFKQLFFVFYNFASLFDKTLKNWLRYFLAYEKLYQFRKYFFDIL